MYDFAFLSVLQQHVNCFLEAYGGIIMCWPEKGSFSAILWGPQQFYGALSNLPQSQLTRPESQTDRPEAQTASQPGLRLHAWLAGLQAWLDDPERGMDGQTNEKTNRKSPHFTGLLPVAQTAINKASWHCAFVSKLCWYHFSIRGGLSEITWWTKEQNKVSLGV